MSLKQRRIPTVAALAAGVVLGWLLAVLPRPTPTLRALGADRWGDTIVTSGPVLVRYDERLKAPLAQDALYYLDYRGGRLLATVPSYQQSGGTTRLVSTFAERDLVADFKLDAEGGPRPHFLMTTGALGQYSEGWSPLFVFETTTNQVATYKVQQQLVGMSSKPSFELLEVRPIGSTPPTVPGNP
jgi:hypothetical protein